MTSDPTALPVVRILPGRARRVRAGHPWVYSNEVEMSKPVKSLDPGEIVSLVDASGENLGTATFSPRPLIAARLLSSSGTPLIDAEWISERLHKALRIRERLYQAKYYRLVYAEADGLPGLIVDRYDDICVVQLNTAGMERLAGPVVDALKQVLSPRGIVIRREGSGRRLEGLEDAPPEILGDVPSPATVMENGFAYVADLLGGQKTGWYYDHQENRARAAALARDCRVLDLYCYLGGFGLQAAQAGASEVLAVDRSQPALDLAARSAGEAGLGARCRFERASVFEALEQLSGENFDLVIADPPAFVKTRKDLKPGIRAYRKLARMAAAAVAPDGILCIASCSHHVDATLFAEQVRRGLRDVGRTGRILHSGGAGPDHPVHPALPESVYLKCLFVHLD